MKEDKVYLQHILESIEYIEEFLEGKTESDFKENVQLQDAVLRRIQIIGEAVTQLSEDFKKNNPDIEWSDITGMRNILVHKYFGIDLELTWETTQKDIPKFKDKIKKLLDSY